MIPLMGDALQGDSVCFPLSSFALRLSRESNPPSRYCEEKSANLRLRVAITLRFLRRQFHRRASIVDAFRMKMAARTRHCAALLPTDMGRAVIRHTGISPTGMSVFLYVNRLNS